MKRVVAPLVLVLLLVSMSFAVPVPTVTIVYNGGDVWDSNYTEGDITVNGDESWYLEDSFCDTSYIDASWDLTFDSDPYVISNLSLTNSGSTNQIFTVTFTVPVSPAITPSSVHGGETGGSFTSDPAGGTLTTLDPDPLYLGMIDGSGVLEIYSHLSQWVRTFGGTTQIDTITDGLPGPTLPSGAVLSSIGIQHRFELTPGDVIALTGYFEVIPEPATMTLFGIGGALLLLRRRR